MKPKTKNSPTKRGRDVIVIINEKKGLVCAITPEEGPREEIKRFLEIAQDVVLRAWVYGWLKKNCDSCGRRINGAVAVAVKDFMGDNEKVIGVKCGRCVDVDAVCK
ncbi:hypothetical protein QIT50_gp10 [Pyrobaculum spherical virus 2]|uniref:Uncharacterized protein n=1 Tax=Pyrobaculum spherical virus 2 TaxID=2730632 RepID=A0A6M3VYX2_9VIRU|nr:hypothetical protein QIT50_gp10 [Pyrobaculum spherical virus 2]QJF12422.1 hypothetical protein PSV2_gp10 [Pyrobaculum spherical virus 2]